MYMCGCVCVYVCIGVEGGGFEGVREGVGPRERWGYSPVGVGPVNRVAGEQRSERRGGGRVNYEENGEERDY